MIPKPVDFGLPPVNKKVWVYACNNFHMNTKRNPELKDKEVLILMLIEAYEYWFDEKNKRIIAYHNRAFKYEEQLMDIKHEMQKV